MNFSRLEATVLQTGEQLVLYDGEFQNFNRLRELIGKDYDNVNDDLMDGITERNGVEWIHNVYDFGEIKFSIEFRFKPIEE